MVSKIRAAQHHLLRRVATSVIIYSREVCVNIIQKNQQPTVHFYTTLLIRWSLVRAQHGPPFYYPQAHYPYAYPGVLLSILPASCWLPRILKPRGLLCWTSGCLPKTKVRWLRRIASIFVGNFRKQSTRIAPGK